MDFVIKYARVKIISSNRQMVVEVKNIFIKNENKLGFFLPAHKKDFSRTSFYYSKFLCDNQHCLKGSETHHHYAKISILCLGGKVIITIFYFFSS